MAKQRKEQTHEDRRSSDSGMPNKPAMLVEDVREAQKMAMQEDRMREQQRRKGGRG
ncbi:MULTISPECIES: hypothetical protein [Streptomyces]|uniref:YfhD family protein n=1 Tax=Streptomyces flavotricini TaxID=66888 RepID=A0ABS8E8R2_9ACTN|nr:hypothetical protein [Streptomyces flavotricini]MCC0096922.1 hypothetical protein [Streptomyces flavotricini]